MGGLLGVIAEPGSEMSRRNVILILPRTDKGLPSRVWKILRPQPKNDIVVVSCPSLMSP